jgi:dTDP-4-dehydrorhamnose reductase
MLEYILIGHQSKLSRFFSSWLDNVQIRYERFTRHELQENPTRYYSLLAKNPGVSSVYFSFCTQEATNNQSRVDQAEINISLPKRLADFSTKHGSKFLVLSSTRVFEGKKPFAEKNMPRKPLTNYGKQKVLIENVMEEVGGHTLRVTKILYSLDDLWVSWCAGLNTGDPITVHKNQFIAPVFPLEVSMAIHKILSLESGLYQFSRETEMSYLDIFQKFIMILQANGSKLSIPNVTLVDTPSTHDSLVTDDVLRSCLMNFELQFSVFVKESQAQVVNLRQGYK